MEILAHGASQFFTHFTKEYQNKGLSSVLGAAPARTT
jgi:hypothetical protein